MEGFSSKVKIRNNIIRETFAEFLGTFTLIVGKTNLSFYVQKMYYMYY